MSRTESLGVKYYKNLLEKGKGMVYVEDTHYHYWDPNCHSGENDYDTYTVRFTVKINGGDVLVTGKNWTGRYYGATTYETNTPSYKGYVLNPNVRYVETTGEWCILDEKTLNGAISEGNVVLVEGLMKHSENYSSKFLGEKIVELMKKSSDSDEDTQRVKRQRFTPYPYYDKK